MSDDGKARSTLDRVAVTDTLSRDDVYEMLSHHRRRDLCQLLHDGASARLDDLAGRIARKEDDTVTDRQVYLSLYHVHLPKLRSAGVVTFDERTETAALGENAPRVLTALDGVETAFAGEH